MSVNTGIGASRTVVEIIGVPSANLTNLATKLYDDDDNFLANDTLYPSLVGLPSPPLPALDHAGAAVATNQERFAAAYISLVNANGMGWNSQAILPFKKNAAATTANFDIGSLQLKGTDRPEFWSYSVVFGYQPGTIEDGEPNAEVPSAGENPESIFGFVPAGYCVVWMESIREREFTGFSPITFSIPMSAGGYQRSYLRDLYAVVAHELAHAPGRRIGFLDHNEGGLMRSGDIKTQAFAPATIKRLRAATNWIH